MSTPADLVAQLLAADPGARARLLSSASAADLERAIAALGQLREQAAADVLSVVDAQVADRRVRKAARRELHRLRSVGVAPAEPANTTPPTVSPAAVPRAETVTVRDITASDIDGSGSRALWLLGERPLGGAWVGAFVLNDVQGLIEMHLIDTTRKRFLQDLDARRAEMQRTVTLPQPYALALVREGVDLARERGTPLPTRYGAFRDLFGEAPAGPERPLVHDTISPVEVTFNPEWLHDSANLIREPEIAIWSLSASPELRTRALQVASSTQASLILPGGSPEQQAERLLAEAGREVVTPEVRRGLRRRLEETAYIFAVTDRRDAARKAVAAAQALADPSLALERVPIVAVLLSAALARGVQSEQVAGRRAGEILVELFERVFARELDAPPATTTTSPGGLILPR